MPLNCRLRTSEPYTDCYYSPMTFCEVRLLCIRKERGKRSLTNHRLRGSAGDQHLRCCGGFSLTPQDDRYIHVNLIKTHRYAAGSMSSLPLRCRCRKSCTQQASKVLWSIMRKLSHGPCMVSPIETLSYTCPSRVALSALLLPAHSSTAAAWASTCYGCLR